ncbi:hypothetical protein J2Z72_000953 [Peptostreptococcus canis]|nr:hypothetical protein [Peptostreptococcus canis]MBP1998059.1 hypothetical protein [Peptostreptococcus canis]
MLINLFRTFELASSMSGAVEKKADDNMPNGVIGIPNITEISVAASVPIIKCDLFLIFLPFK